MASPSAKDSAGSPERGRSSLSKSSGCEPRDTRYPIKIAVLAGKRVQAVMLHDEYDQDIAGKQAIVAHYIGSKRNLCTGDRQDLHADKGGSSGA
jgi:hypothetical protein